MSGTLRIISGPLVGTSVVVEEELVIGRENADVTIEDSELSRRHAAVRPAKGGVVVEDLGSMNGTFVDGRRITEPVELTETATIKMGKSELSLELPPAAPETAAPIPEVAQATRASDVPAVDVADATRARDVPVADVDDATRARDVPVADVDAATRARDVPVVDVDAATRARDVPVADVEQATRARKAPAPPRPPSADSTGGGLVGKLEGVPPIVFGLVAAVLVVVILILLLG